MTTREIDVLSATQREFAVELADSPDALREAQRLRHQVFCLERGILPCEAGGDLETDEFDATSRHVVLRRRSSGEVVGTVRLVVGSRDRPDDCLPMQRYCSPELFETLPMETLGEISRFALSKQRRVPGFPSESFLRLGLMQGILRISGEAGLTHWCAIMERSLLRLLQATGIHFAPLGPMVEAYGLRQPSIVAIDMTLAQGKRQCPDFHSFVTDAIASRRERSRDLLAA
jgi:N-acyl-L-homoserine lactone synthetase